MQSTQLRACRELGRLTLTGMLLAFTPTSHAAAQQGTTKHPAPGMPGMQMPTGKDTKPDPTPKENGRLMGSDMGGMTMMTPDPFGVSMDRMGSGTTWVPDAAPIPSLYFAAPGRWDVTAHGFRFAPDDRHGGPRGAATKLDDAHGQSCACRRALPGTNDVEP